MRRVVPCLLLASISLIACTDSSDGRSVVAGSSYSSRPGHSSASAPAPTQGLVAPVGGPIETHTGRGNGQFTIEWPAERRGYLTFDCPQCVYNVVVKTDGFPSLLVNVLGHYHGTTWFNVPGGKAAKTFTVEASASWTATIADDRGVPAAELGKQASGQGDAVLKIPAGAKSAKFAVTGRDNIVVSATHPGQADSLLLNEIGDQQAELKVTGPGFLQIEARRDRVDGAWTIVFS